MFTELVGGRLTWTGQNFSCMLLAVNKWSAEASFNKRLSSKPNMGAGRTSVVSGNKLRATFSPRLFTIVSFAVYCW